MAVRLLLVVVWAGFGAAPAEAQQRTEREWLWAGAASVVGTALLLDDVAREHLGARDGGIHGIAGAGNALGNGKMVALALAGAAGTGRLTGLRGLSHTAEHTLVALLSAGAINGALKVGVGRRRPDGGDGARFRPFTMADEWQSFPSGHAVTAFAVAAALSEELRRPWVTVMGYGAAGMVGWSRVHENRHWASDVVGGAVVGTLTARTVVRHLHRDDARRDVDDPRVAPSTFGSARLILLPSEIGVTLTTR